TFINQPVVVTGTNFSPNAVAWYSSPCDQLGVRQALSTMRNSDTQIIATIVIRCAGDYSIQVANPQPGGGFSNAVKLTVPSTASPQIIINNVSEISVANPQPNLAASNAAANVDTNSSATIASVDA